MIIFTALAFTFLTGVVIGFHWRKSHEHLKRSDDFIHIPSYHKWMKP